MGYTHYWYREQEIERETMQRIADDFAAVVLKLDELGVYLAGGDGKGVPEITPELVCFNGVENCGHSANASIVIPWPNLNAKGVIDGKGERAGSWFAGALLDKRCCDGDCSYETFYFPREFDMSGFVQVEREGPQNPPERRRYFAFTKTAYRPYDLAVNAFLVIAKHHLGDKIRVSSDGEIANWVEGIELCRIYLGYEENYRFSEGEGLVPTR
jgi:hypothetical protein